MTRFFTGLVAAAALTATASGALPAFAQAGAPIAVREQTQQDRIAQGVRSGELTPRETRRLEGREVRLDNREARMRERDAGRLTGHDRHVLRHAMNRDGRAIYRLKHNNSVG